MPKITLEVKREANNKELLGVFDEENTVEGDASFFIEVEQVKHQPFVSRAPMGGQETEIVSQIAQYFSADSVVRISIEAAIGNAVWKTLGNIVKVGKEFISLNNKQKGNAWGAEVCIKHNLESSKVQYMHFFLDGISENELSSAVSKIESKKSEMKAFLGEEYMSKIKNIGFSYDKTIGSWKLIGVEKFDGLTELPEEKGY